MIFTKSSPKRTARASSDDARLTFDLLSNLTYMAALAVSSTTRDKMFESAITQRYETATYFRQVYLLVKRLGFEYSRAFQLVAKKAGAARVKSFLLRFASSINSGESELSFLSQEAHVQKELYTSEYNRKLESLQKWSDAYAALLVSVAVIIVVAMVSTMIYDAGQAFVMLLSIVTILITALGAFLIYSESPVELKTYRARKGPRLRRWAIYLFVALAPIGAATAFYMYHHSGEGAAFLSLGIALIPSGICALLDDMKVSKADQEVAAFVRALGNVTGALGSTVTVGLARLDLRSMGSLEPHVQRLRSRLTSQLNPAVCWDAFRDEVGSELLNRATRMLMDGVSLGGNAEKVGEIASEYALNTALLRAKRDVAAQTFSFLSFPLHGAMVGLLVFILEVIRAFNRHLVEISEFMTAQLSKGSVMQVPSLPMFQPRDLSLVSQLLMMVIVGFTIANSLAPKFATGGHVSKVIFYFSIMCVISGLCLLFLPPIANKVLT